MARHTRSKKRQRKKTMRGGMSLIEIGIIGGVAGVAALLYGYLRTPSVSQPTEPTVSQLDYSTFNVSSGLPSGSKTENF